MRSHFIVAMLTASVIATPLPEEHHDVPSHMVPHHNDPYDADNEFAMSM